MRRLLMTSAALAVCAIVLAPAASSAQSRPLHITVRNLVFGSCGSLPASVCSFTVTGDVNSNLSPTRGSANTIVLFEDPPGPCVVEDETATFRFDVGTITIRSHHTNCPASVRPGPWIDTAFTVIGGTGAFAGATGGGTEHSSHALQAPVIYNGTIVF